MKTWWVDITRLYSDEDVSAGITPCYIQVVKLADMEALEAQLAAAEARVRELEESVVLPHGHLVINDAAYRDLCMDYEKQKATVTALRTALAAADKYGEAVTRLFLLPPDGQCIACREQVPPAAHHLGCSLKPLMRDVRKAHEQLQQALRGQEGA